MRIEIDLGERSYPVIIGEALLENAEELLRPYIGGKQVCIVSNDVVAPLYLDTLKSQLDSHYSVFTVVLPDGEEHKNLETLNLIFTALLEQQCNRDVTLVALGGGVIGDMTGFAAASFMRGVDFIQVPTTLLAQVDSSVGGKTGVNHKLGKNMIGAFHQPRCVLADVGVLASLPTRELSAGLAEVIKYGLIVNRGFLDWLNDNMSLLLAQDKEVLAYAVKLSCEAKARVVSEDEKEKGLRAILNLGHTFGHAIEAHYQYQGVLHGEAVAIGTMMASKLSQLMGNISDEELSFVRDLLTAAGLPVALQSAIEIKTMMSYMQVDKKAEGGQIRLVLLEGLGRAMVTRHFDSDKMQQAIAFAMPHPTEAES